MLARQQLVRDAREAVNVIARVRLAAVHALDARVRRRARGRRIECRCTVQIERTVTREAEVEHPHFARRRDHDVARLEIGMNHVAPMRVRERRTDAADECERVLALHRSAQA